MKLSIIMLILFLVSLFLIYYIYELMDQGMKTKEDDSKFIKSLYIIKHQKAFSKIKIEKAQYFIDDYKNRKQ